MATWRLNKAPELIAVPIDPNEYAQLLADVSKIIYLASCQLDSQKKISSLNFSIETNVDKQKTEEYNGAA